MHVQQPHTACRQVFGYVDMEEVEGEGMELKNRFSSTLGPSEAF
jgi:hypothetical protein